MRFLADECCDFAAVRTLRAHGHDVLAVGEFQHRSADKDVMDLALAENRILLTEDKDFGWLVFAGRTLDPCVVIHDHRGTIDGSERGLVCSVHNDGIMGRHPMDASQ